MTGGSRGWRWDKFGSNSECAAVGNSQTKGENRAMEKFSIVPYLLATVRQKNKEVMVIILFSASTCLSFS